MWKYANVYFFELESYVFLFTFRLAFDQQGNSAL